jgi:fibronectin type 3 domain-containing protein
MKTGLRIVITISLLMSLIRPAQAATGSLLVSWDKNPETDIAGYKVYYGTASGSYGTPIDVKNVTTYTIPGVSLGLKYYLVVAAYNTSGMESAKSDEVVCNASSPNKPTGVKAILQNIFSFLKRFFGAMA